MNIFKKLFSNKQNKQKNTAISDSELFDEIYPDLSSILAESFASHLFKIFYADTDFHLDNYILQHFPLHSFMKVPNPKCIPDDIFRSVSQDLLYPYGTFEERDIDINTNLPKNFDPLTEVYLIYFKTFNFNLKEDKISTFFINECLDFGDYNTGRAWLDSSSLIKYPLKIGMLPQPVYELFIENYDYKLNYIFFALVFKAKRGLPKEFLEYWNNQSQAEFLNDYKYFDKYGLEKCDHTVDTQYPLMRIFYSFYLMRAYINTLEKAKCPLINYAKARYDYEQSHKNNQFTSAPNTSALTMGNLVYVNKFNFGVITGENTIYLDNGMFMTIDQAPDSFPTELSTHVHFTSAAPNDITQSTPINAELLIIPDSNLNYTLISIKKKLTAQYKSFQREVIERNNANRNGTREK